MVDVLLAPKLSAAGFADRIIASPDGRVLILSRDRKRGSWFAESDVRRLDAYVVRESEPSLRLLRRSMWLNFPFALALLAISANLNLGASIDAYGPVASIIWTLVILVGLPLGMLFNHYRVMRRVMAEVETQIASRPSVEAPASRGRRKLDAVEMVGLLLVAPNLLAALICWIDPDLLRNTPFTQATVSPLSIAVVLALAVRRAAGRGGREFQSLPEAAAPQRLRVPTSFNRD